MAKRNFDKIRQLVFSGGGVNGAMSCGALLMLERIFLVHGLNLSTQIDAVGGCSIGALQALLFVLGMSAEEAITFFYPVSRQLCDAKMSLLHAMKRSGMANMTSVHNALSDLLLERTGRSRMTFAELRSFTNKELRVVVTELRLGACFELSSHHSPHADVVEAVIASMSFPILFQPVQIRGLHPSMYFVDGGVLDNFPFHIFPEESTIGLWLSEMPRRVKPSLQQAEAILETTQASTESPSLFSLALSLEMSLCKRLTLKEQQDYCSKHVSIERQRNVIPLFTQTSGMDMSAVEPHKAAVLMRQGILSTAMHFASLDSRSTDVLVALGSIYEHMIRRILSSLWKAITK